MLEMMVVVAIVLAMTAIVIMYIPQFRDRSALDLVAQEIAITIRSAQVYASGGKIPAGEIEAKPSYGVNFSNNDREFRLYTNDPLAPGLVGSTASTTYKMHAIKISRICTITSGRDSCVDRPSVDIVYTRPQLGAKIYDDSGDSISATEIFIQADKTQKEKKIIVRSNGQISVENVAD